MAEGGVEGGVPRILIDGGDENAPARVADEVEARQGEEQREAIVGDGWRGSAVDARGGGAGKAAWGGDDGGKGQCGGGVKRRNRGGTAGREAAGEVVEVALGGVGKRG